MQHSTLSAQITSKGKKHLQNFQPTFFSEIPYSNATEINYLRDLQQKKQQIDFPIFEFQKDFGEQAPVNEFDMLANTLYKKIMQQGYIQQKKAPSKKKKKTKNPFQYDYEDVWINDQEAITVKKNIYVKFQGVDEFYNSELYKSSLSQIQQQSKKRTNEITMDAQQLQEIKKKIKQNISITHNRMKEQLQGQKPTNILENSLGNQGQIKLQITTGKQQNGILSKVQIIKNEDAQSSEQTSSNKEDSGLIKGQLKEEVVQNVNQKFKRGKKQVSKGKNIKKLYKNQKKQKQQKCELQEMIDKQNEKVETEKMKELKQIEVCQTNKIQQECIIKSRQDKNEQQKKVIIQNIEAQEQTNYEQIKEMQQQINTDKKQMVNENQQ